jgi:hypothetical protein
MTWEIPAGEGCFPCPYRKFWLDYDCDHPDKKVGRGLMVEERGDHKVVALRSRRCRRLYPYGATIEIRAKEKP